MAVTLMNGESVLKEWQYGATKSKLETTDATLIVTNRRVIAESHRQSKMNDSSSRQEIRNADISSFEVNSGVNRNPLFLVLAVLFLIASIVLFATTGFVVGLVGVLLTALFALLFFLIRKACVELVLFKKMELEEVVNIGIQAILPQSNKKSKKKKKNKNRNKVKIMVDLAVVNDISDTIAGLLNT